MDKYFGEKNGIWFCSINDCNLTWLTSEIKQGDDKNLIGWKKISNKSETLFPICNEHGVILNYDTISEESDK